MGCAVDHKSTVNLVHLQIGRQLYQKKWYCNMLYLSISLVLSVCTAAANAARHMDGDDDRLGLAARPLDGGGQHHHTGLLLLVASSGGGRHRRRLRHSRCRRSGWCLLLANAHV